jgi:hypothetical protein
MSVPNNYYVTNTNLSSFPLQSKVGGKYAEQTTPHEDKHRSVAAIINNRNTQFSTLQLPAAVEEAIKKERKYLQHLSVE